MTSNENRDATRGELLRLLKGLDCYRAWAISTMEREKGSVTQEDLNQIVMPGSFFLELFDQTNGNRCRDILRQVRQWYSVTATQLQAVKGSGDAVLAAEVDRFLQRFREDTGFDFHAEAGLVRKTIERALKENRIADETDYRLLKGGEDDGMLADLGPDDLGTLLQLLRDFEKGAA